MALRGLRMSGDYLSSIQAKPTGGQLRQLYPATAFTAEGYLEVGGPGSHRVYWREYGQPAGAPAALFLHGGPGAGC